MKNRFWKDRRWWRAGVIQLRIFVNWCWLRLSLGALKRERQNSLRERLGKIVKRVNAKDDQGFTK